MKANSVKPAYIQTAIIVLAVATALIHFSLNFSIGKFDIIFTLNGIGYLSLLAALFLEIPIARDNRQLVRYGMIIFTAITIIAWILIGDKTWWLGWVAKFIEVLLIGALLMKRS